MAEPDAPPTYPDLLPRILGRPSLNLLAGASGIGKTALIAGLARAIRDQAPVFGHTPAPTAIGYLTADRSVGSSRQWFEAAGYPDIRQYSYIDDKQFNPAKFRAPHDGPVLLQQGIAKLDLPPASLVIVDPIALFLGCNLLNYREVAIACIAIRRWLLPLGHCIIGVCHTAKLKADKMDRYQRPQDRIMGTGALNGFTDTQICLLSPDESETGNQQHTFLWNPHHAPLEMFEVARDPNTGLFLLNQDRRGNAEVLAPELATLYALVPEPPSFVTAPMLVRLMKDVQVDRSTIWRRLKSLEKLGWIGATPDGQWTRRKV